MKRNFGLVDLPIDERDFQLGGYDDLPSLEELPSEFRLPFKVKDQGTRDWCSAYASCAASEVQEGVELEPGYSFAASKEISGNVESWGQDSRSAMASHKDYGAMDASAVPGEIYAKTDKEKRYFDLWRKLQIVAMNHKKKSYFKITGPYSDFDNIRAAIFKYKTPVVIGIQFGYKLTDVYLEEPKDGFGHAMVCLGWQDDYMVVGNSYGQKAGDMGVHYVSPRVINHWVQRYGAFTFIDEDPEVARYNLDHGIKKGDNWFIQLLKLIRSLFKSML